MEFTNNLKLPLLVPNQSGKEFTHNEALVILDNLLHSGVKNTLNGPPPEPMTGDRYLVGPEATGDFLGKENSIAFYDNGWRFIIPPPGQLIWNLALSKLYVFNGAWSEAVVNSSSGEETAFDLNFTFDEPQNGDTLIYSGGKFVNDAALQTFATKDLANVTGAAKNLMGKMSLPSNQYINLTAESSGSSYTAPADGYLNITVRATSDNAQGRLQNTSSLMVNQWFIAKINYYASAFMPCSAGDLVQYFYQSQSVTKFTYHYLIGNNN
ncbi:MAG: DUF2793 domain-containing protein [Rickettsiales bacterium]|jgi:hypothetical protein|nr:DUF2793 domain-containing protein [Rickettsiales bacterium]